MLVAAATTSSRVVEGPRGLRWPPFSTGCLHSLDPISPFISTPLAAGSMSPQPSGLVTPSSQPATTIRSSLLFLIPSFSKIGGNWTPWQPLLREQRDRCYMEDKQERRAHLQWHGWHFCDACAHSCMHSYKCCRYFVSLRNVSLLDCSHSEKGI